MTERHKTTVTGLLKSVGHLDPDVLKLKRDTVVTWAWAETLLQCGKGADRDYVTAEFDRLYPATPTD
jgi:hypothetical protein